MRNLIITLGIFVGMIVSINAQETAAINESILLYDDGKTVIEEAKSGIYHNYIDDDGDWHALHFDHRESINAFYENLLNILFEKPLEDGEYYEAELGAEEDGYRVWVKRYFGETDEKYRIYWSDMLEVTIGFGAEFHVNKEELDAYKGALID